MVFAVVELPDDAIKALVEAASGIDIMPELLARVPEAVKYVDAWRKTLIDNGSLREESPTNEFLGVVTIAATWAVNGVIAARVRAEAQPVVASVEVAAARNPLLGTLYLHESLDFSRELVGAFERAVRTEAVAGERQRIMAGLADLVRKHRVDNGTYVSIEQACHVITAGSVPVATTEPTARDERPHSRACGLRQHEHGSACAVDCPTCAAGGGWHYPVPTPTEPAQADEPDLLTALQRSLDRARAGQPAGDGEAFDRRAGEGEAAAELLGHRLTMGEAVLAGEPPLEAYIRTLDGEGPYRATHIEDGWQVSLPHNRGFTVPDHSVASVEPVGDERPEER